MRTEMDYAPPCRVPAHDDRAMDRDRFNHGTREAGSGQDAARSEPADVE
jgi:hypothetical protein